ncbi:hypothetical protein ACFLVE_03955 [Chloroflexota bacterium]
MKNIGIRISLVFILVAVMVFGSLSPVSAANPNIYKNISNPSWVPVEGLNTPNAQFSFDNIGAWGYRYVWYHAIGGSGYDPIHDMVYVPFEKHMRSATVSLSSPNSVTAADTDIIKVSVWLIKKNESDVRGGATSDSYTVTPD